MKNSKLLTLNSQLVKERAEKVMAKIKGLKKTKVKEEEIKIEIENPKNKPN